MQPRKASLLEGGAERSEAEGESIPPPRSVQCTTVGAGLCAGPGRGDDPACAGGASPSPTVLRGAGRVCNLYSPPPGFAGSPLSEWAFEGCSPEKPPS